MDAAIRFDAVSKSFAGRTALADVSFEIGRGRIVGLIGPNGSGKTTTLRLILNLFYPEQGHIWVLGGAPNPATADRIGYLPEERGLYRNLRVQEVLRYYSRLKGREASARSIDEWLERLQVTEHQDKRISELSKGTAQKIQFIGTVLHRPQLVILDEPFSGLDPVSREHLRRAISHLLSLETTVLLSTHEMLTAERMCEHFLMLHHGRKVLDASREHLAERFSEPLVRLRCRPQLDARALPRGVVELREVGPQQELSLAPGTDPQRLLADITRQHEVFGFEIGRATLEDIFLRLARD